MDTHHPAGNMASPPNLYADDLVARAGRLGVVDRTPEDIDTHVPHPARDAHGPITHDDSISIREFRRFMKDGVPSKGTVLVAWQDEEIELVSSHSLTLVDRSLLIGDIVKRGVNDALSGVVLNTFTTCDIRPLSDVTYRDSYRFKACPTPNWERNHPEYSVQWAEPLRNVPISELTESEAIDEGALVIFDEWLGRIDVMETSISIKLMDGCVVEIGETDLNDTDFPDVCSVGDLIVAKKGILRRGHWVYGSYNANTPPVGTVVKVRPRSAQVEWIEKRVGCNETDEPPSLLEADELESHRFRVYDRTRIPAGPLGDTISNSSIDIALNLRVRFKDLARAAAAHRLSVMDRKDHLGYDLNTFEVLSFRTEVTVQWQDLTITRVNSTDLVQDESIDDEHAVWPGEIAHTLDMHTANDIKRPDKMGVIQNVDAEARMAKIKWSPGSFADYAITSTSDTMFLNYGFEPVPSAVEDQEVSLYSIEAPASINVRRGDIALITGREGEWVGEIVDTPLDGSLVVRLGAARLEVQDIIIPRHQVIVAVRSDNTAVGDEWTAADNDVDMEDSSEYSDDGWDEEEEEAVTVRYEDEQGNVMDEDDVENEDWESANEGSEESVEMVDAPERQTPATSHSITPANDGNPDSSTAPNDQHTNSTTALADTPPRYMVLGTEIPQDHHFRAQPSTETSAHMKRTQKEHKILRDPSTLPEGVYIRTWESRMDLLRVLLIGPKETPYANCPFVFDFYLPQNFPMEPPRSFFHSWPSWPSFGAVGRVNPNLYVDGKICLSILGTWDGNSGESWSAARSTLLQVVISLLGLVLVREPYYNEAGYEALVGSEASKRPSALYSERVFLRAREFLMRAVSNPSVDATGLEGVRDVIDWVYQASTGPQLLAAAIKEVEEVLQRSEGEGTTQEPDGLTILSRGACIPAKKALDELRRLQSTHSSRAAFS